MERSYADAVREEKKAKEPIDEKFKSVIEEIDKTIEFLSEIRYALKKLGQNLPDLNAVAKNIASVSGLSAIFQGESEQK